MKATHIRADSQQNKEDNPQQWATSWNESEQMNGFDKTCPRNPGTKKYHQHRPKIAKKINGKMKSQATRQHGNTAAAPNRPPPSDSFTFPRRVYKHAYLQAVLT